MSQDESTSDEDLMLRMRKGDKQAFGILYERYSEPILSYVCHMVANHEQSQSLARDVFLRAFQEMPMYRYPQRTSVWLFTIARERVIEWIQRQ